MSLLAGCGNAGASDGGTYITILAPEISAGAVRSADGISVQIVGGESGDLGGSTAIASVKFPDGRIKAITTENQDPASLSFWLGRLDGDATRGAIFLEDSGGSHCCTTLSVVTEAYGKPKALEIGTIYGSDIQSAVQDLNGDGITDIVTFDATFLGGFIQYGVGSYFIPKVVNLIKGQVVDISDDPRLVSFWEDTQQNAGMNCADPDVTENDGACAAYVAAGAKLGRVDEAVESAQKFIRPRTAPYEVCEYREDPYSCEPSALRKFKDFGAAIRFALKVNGYTDS